MEYIENDFGDIDGRLLEQFRSLGTTDRDVLIAEFQAVLGNKMSPDICAFFLDMNNWNLQNAVCSYYDFEQPSSPLPSMTVLADVTVGNGEAVAANTNFVKSWRIKNSGLDRWPPGCHMRLIGGENLAVSERKMVEPLDPGQMADVHVEMRSPSSNGIYTSLWRMSTATGSYFGEVIKVQVVVADGGLLGITQQMSRIGGELAHGPAGAPGPGMGAPLTGHEAVSPGTDISIHVEHHQVPCLFPEVSDDVGENDAYIATLPATVEEEEEMS
ncbi:unnamed protein product [Candidula unifasciata]|uniref:Nbr1 FW domain-containing protein n=1 Tax=Candidula unifasciata TaxID=100452 RepID=A0A8S3Z179_9EUPU|nr:unnamed protein product [Candidula unifasciata]